MNQFAVALLTIMLTNLAYADVCVTSFQGTGYGSRGLYKTSCNDGEISVISVEDSHSPQSWDAVTSQLNSRGSYSFIGSYFRGGILLHVQNPGRSDTYCVSAYSEKKLNLPETYILDCNDRSLRLIDGASTRSYLETLGLKHISTPDVEAAVWLDTRRIWSLITVYKK